MSVLLTGFTPFSEVSVNPSEKIVALLAERPDVIPLVLPTEYEASAEQLRAAILAHNPEAIILLGVAQNRPLICLERVALNLDDASIPDNAGDLATGRPIVPGGPLALESTLPVEAMRDALLARGIPAAVSNHAGTYVCNHVFYTARHVLTEIGRDIPCGFIHVPGLRPPEGDAVNGLALDTMVEAVGACIDLLVRG